MSTTNSQDTQPVSITDKANKFLADNKDLEPNLFKENLKTIEDEALRAVIIAEKKVRDTQASFTKNQQELSVVRAKADVLERLTTPKVELDEATKARLDELKYSDPDAWKAELDKLEAEAKVKHKELLTQAEQEALKLQELNNRGLILEDFNRRHPGFQLTDEMIRYDIPPRITSKLEKGEIGFEAYLQECYAFMSKPKVIGDGNKVLEQPNLSKEGGDDTPTKGAVNKSIAETYKDLIF